MTETQQALETARVLYKHFIEIGRTNAAENLLIRFPELKDETIKADSEDKKAEEEAEPEVKKSGKVRKR